MRSSSSWSHAEAGGQPDVVAGRADLELVIAGGHGQAFGRGIVVREVRRGSELEGDQALLARSEWHALEAAELLVRPRHLRPRVARVELDDFVAGSPADVLHADGHADHVARARAGAVDAQVGVLEARVREPVAERIERV